ncbi:alpha/beta hydrolase [Svornostia abyssi]|uniref:Alpha/beta hydrolase n=1 Tax=Svornostia abyssi TaxID=2898438 RepID=A0ABY5PGU8_9ACTN|nr:alpha/beta hydrolase [Parviterribacteraceae bacterium J379]
MSARAVTRAGLGALAIVGAHRLYLAGHWQWTRLSVKRIEPKLEFDPDFQFSTIGNPVFLSRPDAEATVIYLDGFRIQPAAEMHRDWFDELHAAGINVIAPVLGIASAPLELRNRDWSYLDDARQAVQLLDVVRTVAGPDHRIIVVAFSWSSALAVGLAVRRQVDGVVLISPILPPMITPGDTTRFGEWAAPRWWAPSLVPHVTRRKVRGGGWDIADPEHRRRSNTTVWNNRELRLTQVHQVYRAAEWMRDRTGPKLRDQQLAIFAGDSDRHVVPGVQAKFAEMLRRNGNDVDFRMLEGCGHCLLMDHRQAEVKSAIRDMALGRARTPVPVVAG